MSRIAPLFIVLCSVVADFPRVRRFCRGASAVAVVIWNPPLISADVEHDFASFRCSILIGEKLAVLAQSLRVT